MLRICAFAKGCPLAPKPAAVSKTVAASAAVHLQELQGSLRELAKKAHRPFLLKELQLFTATPPSAAAAPAASATFVTTTVAAGTWTLEAFRLLWGSIIGLPLSIFMDTMGSLNPFCSWALSVSQQVRPRSEAQFC